MDLDKLIAHFRGPLTGLISSWGASPADAIEICMDTFAEGYLARERFRGNWDELSSTGGWLRGIAYNLFRARRRSSLRSMESMGEKDFAGPEESDETQSDSRASQVRRAMELLQEDYRTVLYMRYVENSGLAEIAGLLGLTERAVEGRLYRARKALGDRLMPVVPQQEILAERKRGEGDHE